MKIFLLALLLTVTACVPMTEPPQLAWTPGAPVVVTDETYTGAAFVSLYPLGWRVVTSAADAPPAVTFVAPDDCAVIVIATLPVEAPPLPADCGESYAEARRLLDGAFYAAGGVAPVEGWVDFLPTFERVAGSVEPSVEVAGAN